MSHEAELIVPNKKTCQSEHSQLKTSELRYRRLFETARDGILILDLNTATITDANTCVLELVDCSRQEVLGKGLHEIGLFKDEPSCAAALKRLCEIGHIHFRALSLTSKSGTQLKVDFVSNVYDEDGVKVIQCNIRDMSERIRADEDAARLAAIVESSDDAIICKSLDGIITTWNAGAEKMYGYTAEEAIGRPVSFLAPAELPDEMPLLLGKIRRGEPVDHYETIRVRKDGSQCHISLSISPLRNSDGHIVGASSIKRDITGRRLSDQQLRMHSHLLSVIGQAVIVTEPAGEINYWNEFAETLYGWSSSEALGRNILDMTPTEATRKQAAEILASLRDGESWSGELAGQRRDGSTFPSYVTKTSVRDDTGQVVSIIDLSLDISTRKQAETSLQNERDFIAAVVNTVGSLVLVVDRQGRIVRFNHACEHVTGYSVEEVRGKEFKDVLLAPEDVTSVTEVFMDLCAGNFPNTHENTWITKDGSRRLIAWSNTALLDAQGAVEYVIGTGSDITARKQAEEEASLLQSEIEEQRQSINAVVATVPGVVWEASVVQDASSQHIDFVSDYIEIMLGYSVKEWLASPNFWLNIIHPDDKAQAMSEAAEIFAGGQGGCSIFRWIAKDGSILWVESHMVIVCDEAQCPVSIRGVTIDITKRREAETSLIESERRLALATEAAGMGIWDWDLISGELVWDEQMYVLYGASKQGFSGAYDAWQMGLHPDDRERAEADLKAALDGTHDFNSQFRIVWPNGEVHHIEAHAVVMRSESGAPLNVVGVNWDITERREAEIALRRMHDELEVRVQDRTAELERANHALQEKEAGQQIIMDTLGQSEERFRLLVESVHDYAILMLDTSGNVLTWNAGAEHLNGYRAEEIIGRSFSCFYTEEDRQQEKPQEELEIATVQGFYDEEGWRVRRDGSRFWATVVITALRDDGGDLRGFVKVTHDITERKNIEAALRVAKDQADAANQAKSEFMSRMSHELRTPLNAILGFGQLLAKQDFAPAQQERVQYILKAGRHLLDLINEVLEISRIEAGHMVLSLEPVPVGETVEEVFALVRPLASENGIQLIGIDPTEADVHVLADRQRLKQVLLNLCSNAIKYNRPEGSIRITLRIAPGITTPQDPEPKRRLCINISDTGIGIAPSARAQLFVPFMRVGAEQTAIEGTGLGLALSLSLMHAMDGTIGVESTVGVGSTFCLQLPLVSGPVFQGQQCPTHDEIMDGETPDHENPAHFTLLYIEDNLSNLQLIEAIIADQPQYELISAMQGDIGQELARQHKPDLILLDLHLPDIPGDQILARLKADPITANIPVVMLSAVAMEREIQRLLAIGARAYLTKPLDIAKFLDTLAEVLQPARGSV